MSESVSHNQSYHVEWFVTRDAQFDVTVRIGDGRLLGVESGCAKDAIDLGSVALVAGLVNAHTHLEFSSLTSPIPTTVRFTDWIRAVVAHRREHPSSVGAAIRSGIRESLESGTTLIGDIATSGWTTDDYAESQFRGVIFQEILGLSPERIAQQKELARSLPQGIDDAIKFGISPHAPYSTHWELVSEAVKLAQESGRPLAMHLAETSAELELLAKGSGEFRELLMDFGLWREGLFDSEQGRRGEGEEGRRKEQSSAWERRPMDYLELLAEAPRSLIIHGNYLDDDELAFMAARPQMTLVYCPRTHAAFGHREHPWRRLRQLGGRVALGTDSRASNPDLSLFAELQFMAVNSPEVPHLDLLQLGSIEGRRALGIGDSNGANLTLIRLANPSVTSQCDVFAPKNRVCGTMIAGQWEWLAEGLRDARISE